LVLRGTRKLETEWDCSMDSFTVCAYTIYCATDRTKEVDIDFGGREEYVQDFGGKHEGKRPGRGWSVIRKYTMRKQGGRLWIGLIWLS